jgi:L-amino acid ligase
LIDPEGAPVLVESGARFMGSAAQSLVSEAFGTNALLLTAEALLVPGRFAERLRAPAPRLEKMSNMVQMVSSVSGTLHRYALEKLAALPSFHGVDGYLKPGDAVKPTVDSYSSPGLIFLNSASEEVLERDYRAIRELEARGELYELTAG